MRTILEISLQVDFVGGKEGLLSYHKESPSMPQECKQIGALVWTKALSGEDNYFRVTSIEWYEAHSFVLIPLEGVPHVEVVEEDFDKDFLSEGWIKGEFPIPPDPY